MKSVQRLREFFDELLEDLWVVLRERREGLAVEGDVLLLESADELRVGEAERASSCIDAEREEVAHVALLRAAVLEGIGAGVLDSLLCYALLRLAVEAVALRLRQDILAALILHRTSFDACHICLEEAALISCGHRRVEADLAGLLLALRTRRLCVEMVMARDAGDDFAFLRDTKTLLV